MGILPLGVILAGGLSRRMGGGDKTLVMLGDRTILQRIADRLAMQVKRVVLSANGDPERFKDFDGTIIADVGPAGEGPLAGILAAMRLAAAEGYANIVTVPGDAPFLPPDLVISLQAVQAVPEMIVIASSGGKLHPVAGLWPTSLADELEAFLQTEDRRVRNFVKARSFAVAEFDVDPVDPFFNVNTPADLEEAERMLAELRP
jgi:molybdopterin-guanine dinucleotide biosynthesis protein A